MTTVPRDMTMILPQGATADMSLGDDNTGPAPASANARRAEGADMSGLHPGPSRALWSEDNPPAAGRDGAADPQIERFARVLGATSDPDLDPILPPPAKPAYFAREPAAQQIRPDSRAAPYLLSAEERCRTRAAETAPEPAIAVPPPVPGRAAGRAAQAKTRQPGSGHLRIPALDPQARGTGRPVPAATRFPVGWLVVTAGPGRGAQFTLCEGLAQIGRDEDQTVRLDFGDRTILRTGHAHLACDSEKPQVLLYAGSAAAPLQLNGRALICPERLSTGDEIRIGETLLRYAAFCGPDFTWAADRTDAGEA